MVEDVLDPLQAEVVKDINRAPEIRHVATAEDARYYCDYGYCPVECSFGNRSVVDELKMDHHGELAHLEPVALRAYRDWAGSRALDRRFIVTGEADADATFAIAALAGLVPHPRFQFESTGPDSCLLRLLPFLPEDPALARSLELARTIARADLDPLAETWADTDPGLSLLAFKQRMLGQPASAEGFLAGVAFWKEVFTRPLRDDFERIRANELQRVQTARKAAHEILTPHLAWVESAVWGWDVWYREIAQVIVAYQSDSGRCSIGCRDEETACRLLGSQGLLSVATRLSPPGWGGRLAIIGSPRDRRLTREEAQAAARQLQALLQPLSRAV